MEDSVYKTMSKIENTHWWFIVRRKIINNFMSHFIKNNNNRIVEIGSGTGGNIPMLSQYGSVTGIEPNTYAKKYSEKKGFHIIEDFFPSEYFTERTNIIALLDVLEHIENDEEILKHCYNFLENDGKIIITVPAYQFMWSHHDEKHHHKKRYTKKNLEYILEKQGFKIIKNNYFNSILFPIIYIKRKLSKYDNDDKQPNFLLNTILKNIFSIEIFLINKIKIPFGLSIIVIAEKQSIKLK